MIVEALAPPTVDELYGHDGPTIEELFNRYGPMPANRIRLDRFPATEEDVDELRNSERKLYELVDGVLLEKVMAYAESHLAGLILTYLNVFVVPRKLGFVAGADGMMRLAPGLVRIPDASFVSREQFPTGLWNIERVPSIYPNLAVEVLSESNTKPEMEEKLLNYFDSGTSLVWYVDPESRTVRVYTSPEEFTTIPATGVLDGGTVLPGFTLPVADIFAELASGG
jgi:Uma2 family endonuclease